MSKKQSALKEPTVEQQLAEAQARIVYLEGALAELQQQHATQLGRTLHLAGTINQGRDS